MSQPSGVEVSYTLYKETAYKQDPGTPDGHKLYLRSCGVQAQQRRVQDETLRDERGQGKPGRGNINVSGPMVSSIDNATLGFLLEQLFGSVNTTGAGPYTHEFTPGALPVGFVLEKNFGSAIANKPVEKFNGCRVAGAQLEIVQEGFPSISWDVRGAKQALAAAPLDASITDHGFIPLEAFAATIQEGGVAMADVLSGRIQFSNDLDESLYTVGGGERGALPEGYCVVTGEFTALFKDITLLEKAINNTESSFKYTLQNGTGDGSAGNEFAEFFVEKLVYERTSAPIEGPRGVRQTLRFTGYSDAGAFAKATLKNQIATY